jgi:hypothetical protein
MSKRRVAALVCEGQTDVPILEAMVRVLWPDVDEVLVLQPELDELGKSKPGSPAGWSAVKAWCEQNAASLDEVIDPLVGDPIDMLLVVIDVDIAIQAGIADPPQEVGAYETRRLCDTIKTWLTTRQRRRLPAELVIAIPTMAIEAWIVAALFPREKAPESIADPAQLLVDKKKLYLSPSDGKPWKYLPRYRDEFAKAVSRKLSAVRKACPEAERTCGKIEKRYQALKTKSARGSS